MILIVADPRDVHACVVARQLELRGVRHAVVNSADFPQRMRMSARYESGRFSICLESGSKIVDNEDVHSIWLRRFHAHEMSPSLEDESVAAFAYQETRDLFFGWVSTVANVINPRNNEWRAEFKPFQLHAAQEVGLRVPRTLISNDPEQLREFAATADGEIVFKTLSSTQFQFSATTVVEERHLELLESARLAPTMFQQRIHAERHLRITLVDDRSFTAAIVPTREEAMLDWRLDRDPRMEAFTLDPEIERRVQALRRRLGLRYGAIDMIVDKEGEYHFLEINPGGQFLFAEIHAGLPISEAIADALMAEGTTPEAEAPADVLKRL